MAPSSSLLFQQCLWGLSHFLQVWAKFWGLLRWAKTKSKSSWLWNLTIMSCLLVIVGIALKQHLQNRWLGITEGRPERGVGSRQTERRDYSKSENSMCKGTDVWEFKEWRECVMCPICRTKTSLLQCLHGLYLGVSSGLKTRALVARVLHGSRSKYRRILLYFFP